MKVAAGVVFGLVLAIAFALPAVGAPGPLDLAKRALVVGKKADRKASTATKRARQARKVAKKALRSGRQANVKGDRALAQIKTKVPLAEKSESAAVADKLADISIRPIRVRVPVSASAATENEARTQASKVPLFSQGSLTIYGKCFAETGAPDNPGTFGEIYLDTSAEGVLFDSPEDGSGNGFLNPGAPEEDRLVVDQASFAGPGNPGTLNLSSVSDSPLQAIAPDVTIQADLAIATKVGNPPAGHGVFGPGNGCIFIGHVEAY